MKTRQICTMSIFIWVLISWADVFGQVSGNVAYDKNFYQNLKSTGTSHKIYLGDSTMLIESRILLNILADEYVAIFGVAEEGKTVAEANEKIDKRINDFISAIKKHGIGTKDFYVDFITQNRIYDYEMSGNTTYEKLVGFELKKNISIHFKDKNLIDKLTTEASKLEIFDLIKVDYIVSDIPKMKSRMFEEAMKVINSKKAMYISQTNIKLLPQSQIYYESYGSYAPSELYGSYTAYESGGVSANYYQSKTTTVQKRKMTTFYFKSIDQSGFDFIINPVIIEPVVQFTYILQVKFEIEK